MSNRSGSPYSAPTDANRHPLLTAASTTDGITPVVLEADPSTHLLQIGTGSILANTTYDYVGMSNADGNGNYQTVVYKSGGASGTTKATLAITYDGSSNITSITRS
jgi:hypothetical protein